MKTTSDPFGSEAQGAAMSPRRAALVLRFGLAYYRARGVRRRAAVAGAVPAPDLARRTGLPLGALLVAPVARWVPLAGLVFVATLVVGLQAGARAHERRRRGARERARAGAGGGGAAAARRGRVHIGTLAGMTAFLGEPGAAAGGGVAAEAVGLVAALRRRTSGRSGRAPTSPTSSA